MKYYLYKFSDNWADEMDIEGFAILTENEKKSALAQIRKQFRNGGTICFGTNEDNEYDSLSDVLACIEFKQITGVEYNAIRKAFGATTFGETGPLDSDYDDDDDCCEDCGNELDEDGNCSNCDIDDEFCEECGCILDNDFSNVCLSCEAEDDEEEEEYDSHAKSIHDFIKKEYGLEEAERVITQRSPLYHSYFLWKPTPNTELQISIEEFDDGDEEVELILRFNGKEKSREFFYVDGIWSNPGKYLKPAIKELIEKAKKY